MFDNIGQTIDEEAAGRSVAAVGLVALFAGIGWAIFVSYTLVRAAQATTALARVEPELVDLILDDAAGPGLQAPAPPPLAPRRSANAAPNPAPTAPHEPSDAEVVATAMVEPRREIVGDLRDPGDQGDPFGDPRGGGEERGDGSGGGTDRGGAGTGGVRTFHASDLRKRRMVEPQYPEVAKGMNLGETRCVATVRIDEEGSPMDVAVSGCPPVFHQAVQEALFEWRWYAPRDPTGTKVKAEVRIGVTFRLGE